jgi:hypothetical protein
VERCLACEADGRNLRSSLAYKTNGKRGLLQHLSRRAAILNASNIGITDSPLDLSRPENQTTR